MKASAGRRVSSISPTQISQGGGVIFVSGSGFAADNFNFNDPILGNKIWFYNDFETLPCKSPVDKNWLLQNPQAPSTKRVACSLPARQSERGGNVYTMKMTVDGEEIADAGSKTVKFESYYTPRLRSVDHRYGAPGDLITVTGRIMSHNVGPGAQDLDNFDEMDDKSLQNFFLGTAPCDFMNELGTPYGVYRNLHSDGEQYSFEGNFTCKTSGTFIGPQEGQLLVSRYGLSVTDKSAYSVNSKGQKFFYHTLPEVSSIGPNVGSDNGGTYLTIEGKGFDGYKDNTQVFVNDALCENVEVTSSSLVCRSPALTEVGASTGGARGLKYNLWIGELVDETDIGAGVDALDASASEEFIVDGGFIDQQMSTEQSDYTGKLSGLLVAPETGNFSFALCANDAAELYLGTSEDPASKVLIASIEDACNDDYPDINRHNLDLIPLVKGQNYWIEAVHIQRDSVASNKTNFLQISIRQYNTKLNEKDLSLAVDELQVIYAKSERVLEKQRITLDGVAGSDLTFTHNGIPSQTPVLADDFQSYEENLLNMFKWQCTSSQTRFALTNDFESEEDKWWDQHGSYRYWGYGDEVSEPFCGNGVLDKPWQLFRGESWNWKHQPMDVSNDGRYFCFAHKGTAFYDGIHVLYEITTKSWSKWGAWVAVNVTLNSKDDWNYQCVDLLEHFKTDSPEWFVGNWQESTPVKIRRLSFPHDDTLNKFGFIDEASFGSKENTIERIPPAFYNTATRLESLAINVTSDSSVEIEFNPYTCQSEEETFQLLGVAGATIDEMTTSATGFDLVQEQIAFLKANDMATFSVGGGKVIIERISKESPKLGGTFDLVLGDKVAEGISPYVSAIDMQDILETEFGLAGVAVRQHTWNKCYNWDISWYYRDIPGDQPQIEINTTNIINNSENPLHKGAYEAHKGSVKIIQPGGDFFRLAEDSSADPVVTVWVSGFLSTCASDATCSFSYDSSLDTEISAVSSALVDGSVVLTIDGSGFTEDALDFDVDVGGRKCSVTAASASSITCTLEDGPAGDLDVSVWVKSKGKAAGSVTFTLSLEIVSFSPASGSVGGGTTLTVDGTGFPNTLADWEGNTVTVGGGTCKVLETSYTQFKCVTPPADSTGRRRKRSISDSTATISITVNGQSADSTTTFGYTASSTPTVTDLSTLVGSPTGGEALVITGAMFDYESPFNQVTLGEDGPQCEIQEWKPTEITCILPPLGNGNYDVIVKTKDNGNADTSQVSQIQVDFTVTGAAPLVGSVQGGTKMNIVGSGFGNCSDVVFNVGPEHNCEVEECTDSLATCTIRKNPTMHVIYNTGKHNKFGPGYVWEPSELTIRPGDKVRWSWNLPVTKEGTGVSLFSAVSGTAKVWDGKGFKSGSKSVKGNYIYQFSTEGTFFYNTEDVIAGEDVYMPGKVVVAAPSEDEVVEVTASVGTVVATTVVGAAPAQPSPADGCTFADNSCASPSTSTDAIEFTFASCLSPEISSVMVVSGGEAAGNSSAVMGYGDAQLTISGSGFSSVQCENIVKVGESPCSVTAASDSEIVCDVDTASVTSLMGHTVSVNVQNNGEAVQRVSEDTAGKLYVVPKVETISPVVGSWAGGSILTLTGTGLNPHDGIVTVNFGEPPFQKGCAIVEVTSTKIACQVPDHRDQKFSDEKTVMIDIYFSGQMLRGEVMAGTDYTFSASSTPTSEAATPAEYSSATDIEITGSGFGSDVSGVR